MIMEITQKNNMVFIGNIQDIGKPYVDLYLDKEKNALFLFVRLSSPAESSPQYAAISVTPNQVMDYMESTKPIADLFSSRHFQYAFIKDRTVNMEDHFHTTSESTFMYNLPFDPHFCYNKVKLKMALKRMMQVAN